MVARGTDQALNDRDVTIVAEISFYETFAYNGAGCVNELPR